MIQTLTRPAKVADIIEVHCVVEPWPGCNAGAATEEFFFSVANTGDPYIPRIKRWLDQQYPLGYRIQDMWTPEPVSESPIPPDPLLEEF